MERQGSGLVYSTQQTEHGSARNIATKRHGEGKRYQASSNLMDRLLSVARGAEHLPPCRNANDRTMKAENAETLAPLLTGGASVPDGSTATSAMVLVDSEVPRGAIYMRFG